MVKPYFPDFFGNHFTRTPNLFFDDVLCKGTLAEIKVVGCLIRRTLGFNNEAGWTGLSRSKIAKLMNMSERSVTTGAQGAEEKGWILVYDDPRKGKGHQPKYYFLNNTTNQLIVYGLERKKFFVEDLEDLTLSGIKKLLIKSELMDEDGTPLVQLGKDFHENECSREKNSPVRGEKNSPVRGEKNSPVDKGQSQERQGVPQPLNTTTEIHSLKYNIVVVVDRVIEKWNDLLVKKGEEPMTPELARELLDDAELDEEWVIKCIENVAEDYENVDEAIAAVRFAIKHYGWQPRKKHKKNKKVKSPSNKKAAFDLPKSLQQEENGGNKDLDGKPDPQAEGEIRELLRRLREKSQKPNPKRIKQKIHELEKLKREEEQRAFPNQTLISSYIRSIEDLKKQLRALQERESEESEVRV